jgi:hypothetical protein
VSYQTASSSHALASTTEHFLDKVYGLSFMVVKMRGVLMIPVLDCPHSHSMVAGGLEEMS